MEQMSVQKRLGGTFDYDLKSERLTEVKRELENPDIWNNVEKAQALGKEKASLEGIVNTLDNIKISCFDSKELLFLAIEENDMDRALIEYGKAQSLFPENIEMSFWKAIALLNNGKKEEAKKIFDIVFKQNPNWKKLIYRLPKSGIISMTVKELDSYFIKP